MTSLFKSMLCSPNPDQMDEETDKAYVYWRANQSDKSSAPWCISGQFLHFLKLTFTRAMRGRMYGVWPPYLSFPYGLQSVFFAQIHDVRIHLLSALWQCMDVLRQCIFRVWVQEFGQQENVCIHQCMRKTECHCHLMLLPRLKIQLQKLEVSKLKGNHEMRKINWFKAMLIIVFFTSLHPTHMHNSAAESSLPSLYLLFFPRQGLL